MRHVLDVEGRGLAGECAGTAKGGLMASGWRPVSLGADRLPFAAFKRSSLLAGIRLPLFGISHFSPGPWLLALGWWLL